VVRGLGSGQHKLLQLLRGGARLDQPTGRHMAARL
jgi:hypothetical protein